MVCYHELKDENFPTATSVASLQPKSLQMRQTLSKSYTSNLQPEFYISHADSQFKKTGDTEENSDITHDIRGVEQEV